MHLDHSRSNGDAIGGSSDQTPSSPCFQCALCRALLCRPCSSATTGRWLTPAHPRDLAMTTSANRGLRLLAAGHAIYVGTHTSRAAYHRRVNTGLDPPPRLPLVPLGAANRSFDSFELFSLPGAAACRNRTDDLFITRNTPACTRPASCTDSTPDCTHCTRRTHCTPSTVHDPFHDPAANLARRHNCR